MVLRRWSLSGSFWGLPVGALLMACSGGVDDEPMVGDTSGGSGGSSSNSGGQDGSNGGDASTGGEGSGTGGSGGDVTSGGSGASGGNPDEQILGRVTAAVRLTESFTTSLRVDFVWESFLSGSSNDCPRTTVGDCTIADCWIVPPGSDTDPPFDAGTVHFTVDNGMTFETSPDPVTKRYSAVSQADLLGGELISVTADGGSIEGFSSSINLPLAPMILEPAVAGGGDRVVEVAVPTNQDFSVTWDARGTSEYVEFEAFAASDEPNFSCTFEAQPGGAVIPAQVLQHVGAGTELRAWGVNSDTVLLSNGYVEVEGRFDLVNETRDATPLFVLK